MSRRSTVIAVAVSALVVSAVGLSATWWVKSPQQVAAEAAPPAATTLTAKAERRVLRETVVLRGSVAAGASFELTPTLRESARPVVTAVRVKVGQQVSAGTVLLEVAGRPLVVLPGDVPAYRDLRPGLQGKDIAQLQAALRALGHDPGESSGYFGAGTKRAVSAFYRKLGYTAVTTGAQDERDLEAARDRVTKAERALADAKESLTRAETNGDPTAIQEARTKVRYAEEDLSDARKALSDLDKRTGPMVQLSEYAFLPNFPARIDALTAVVGGEAKAPLITVSSGSLQVNANVSPAQRGLLKPGMKVEIVSETMNITGLGVVESIGELITNQPGSGQGSGGFPMVVTPTSALDERLIGQNVRLTVEAASSDGEVLVVPLTAVYAGADGRTAVMKQTPDGREERVVVTVGIGGDGYVAVIPVVAGALLPGDLVTVGVGASK